MLKPITCGKCRTGIGWYDTKFYNVVKPEVPAGVIVLVAVIGCKCGANTKFDGPRAKKKAISDSAQDRHRAGIQIPFVPGMKGTSTLASVAKLAISGELSAILRQGESMKTETKLCGCVHRTDKNGGKYWRPCKDHDHTI